MWSKTFICACLLQNSPKVPISYSRPPGSLEGAEPLCLYSEQKLWTTSGNANEWDPRDPGNKRLLSLCKALKCHLAILLTSAGAEKQPPPPPKKQKPWAGGGGMQPSTVCAHARLVWLKACHRLSAPRPGKQRRQVHRPPPLSSPQTSLKKRGLLLSLSYRRFPN